MTAQQLSIPETIPPRPKDNTPPITMAEAPTPPNFTASIQALQSSLKEILQNNKILKTQIGRNTESMAIIDETYKTIIADSKGIAIFRDQVRQSNTILAALSEDLAATRTDLSRAGEMLKEVGLLAKD
jgi:hypothetical protein